MLNEVHLEIRKQRRGLISAGVILHHDKTPSHTSHLVSSTIHNELLRNLLCSQDLAPAITFLFPALKDCLKGRHYNDRNSLGSSIHQCMNNMSEEDDLKSQRIGKK